MSVLILGKGDSPYTDRNAQRLNKCCVQRGLESKRAEYQSELPPFSQQEIVVMLQFPYQFWNEHCEVPDSGLYGTSETIVHKLSDFFGEEEDRLQNFYSSHRLSFIVNPKIAALDRDKMAIISLLRAAGIPSTKPVKKDLSSILSAVEPGKGVFIKCRYGAEGKGITYLGFDRWCTNYRVNGGLENYGVHDPWPFTDITGKEELLGQLLKLEVVVEQEITPPGEEKFDVRLYVVDGKVPHFFERRNSKEKIITNYSQGGRIKHYPNTAIPLSSIEQIKELAIQTADALGFRFLGVDCMFDESFSNPRVVEVQTFTDFPDVRKFNLAEYLAQHLFR